MSWLFYNWVDMVNDYWILKYIYEYLIERRCGMSAKETALYPSHYVEKVKICMSNTTYSLQHGAASYKGSPND